MGHWKHLNNLNEIFETIFLQAMGGQYFCGYSKEVSVLHSEEK